MLRESRLPKSPEPAKLEDHFFTLEFHFGRDGEATHMGLECSEAEHTTDLAHFWAPYKDQAPRYLHGHEGWFSLSVPDPLKHEGRFRLHIAVPFVDINELDDPSAVEHRQDFDRLMDVVQRILGDMVEAGFVAPREYPIDIVVEPLTPKGDVKLEQVDWASFAVGATWLTYQQQQLFAGYRVWNPETGRWESGD